MTASQLLFDGSYLVGLKASRMYVDLMHKQELTKTDLAANLVSKAYYNALISSGANANSGCQCQTTEKIM
ncbi:MAG: hypothetical protein R2847_05320 [Bacteroidia bacterium]